MRAGGGDVEATARVDVAVDKGEARLVELVVDRREGREQALVVGRIGRVADADQRAVDREQATAGAALHGLACHLEIRWAEVLVDCGDPAVVDRRILAAVAADGDDGRADGCGTVGAPDADGIDRRLGENAHQREVALQVPGDHLSGNAPRALRTEEIDFDAALAL